MIFNARPYEVIIIVKSLFNQTLNLNSNSKFNLFEKKVGVTIYSEASSWKF